MDTFIQDDVICGGGGARDLFPTSISSYLVTLFFFILFSTHINSLSLSAHLLPLKTTIAKDVENSG